MATHSSGWPAGISWPDPRCWVNAIKVRICHVVCVMLTAQPPLCVLLFCFNSATEGKSYSSLWVCQDSGKPYMPPCLSQRAVFSGRCWAPSGPAWQIGCCSNPRDQKGEGETNLLTLCRRDAIMSWSDGTVRGEQKGKGNYWQCHIKVSGWNKPYKRITHLMAFSLFP